LGNKIKTKEMGAACSTYGREETYVESFWWENFSERDHLGELSVSEKIILKWVFKKWDQEAWIGSMWLRIETGGGESDIEPSGSIKCVVI
jgi:hypothetical protein